MPEISITPLHGWIAKHFDVAPQNLTRELIERRQLERLNQTIEYARSKSVFYSKYLPPHLLTDLKQLSSIPLISASDVESSGQRMLCVSQKEISRVVTFFSSGTTGNPKRLFFSEADQELTVDFFQCGLSTLIEPEDRVGILFPCEKQGGLGDLIAQALARINAVPLKIGIFSSLENCADQLIHLGANALVGFPVHINALLQFSKFAGKPLKIRKCLLSADSLPHSLRKTIQDADCEVFDHFGMTETGLGGAVECAVHDGMHIRENDLLFEIVDALTGEPIDDGEYGEIVFSTLTRNAMPLIRYRTGDISRITSERCACGSCAKRLERIQRRITSVHALEDSACACIAMPELDKAHACVTMPELDEAHTCVTTPKLDTAHAGVTMPELDEAHSGVTMSELDEALFAQEGVLDFNAVLNSRKLRLEVFSLLQSGLIQDPKIHREIIAALRSIPSLKGTSVDVNVIVKSWRNWSPQPFKRKIKCIATS